MTRRSYSTPAVADWGEPSASTNRASISPTPATRTCSFGKDLLREALAEIGVEVREEVCRGDEFLIPRVRKQDIDFAVVRKHGGGVRTGVVEIHRAAKEIFYATHFRKGRFCPNGRSAIRSNSCACLARLITSKGPTLR